MEDVVPSSTFDLKSECKSIVRNHRLMISGNIESIINGTDTLQNPLYSFNLLIQLCYAISQIFKNEPSMLRSDEPIIIVGDIHGHLLDLARIFINFGYPPSQRYLFLGDFVDRGEFSTECITLIYALKYLYPNHILIIRGNHEFLSTTLGGGFAAEIEQLYPRKSLFNHFIESFEYMPLSALLFNKILCMHGGICPELYSISQLEQIERPIADYDDPLYCGIVWSDPSFTITDFLPSRRGTGWLFGSDALNLFLEQNNLNTIIRGHECVQEGCEWCFDGQLLTVFSASNYCGTSMNKAAVVFVSGPDKVEPIQINIIGQLSRASSKLVLPLNVTDNQINSLKVPEILRIHSVIVGNLVKTDSPLIKKLNVGPRLKKIIRYRKYSSQEISSITKIFPFQ